jgi:phosphate transport system protein
VNHHKEHTDRAYESELRALREHILLMGAKVEQMIAGAIEALVERDSQLAQQTGLLDKQVNWLEVETDDLCLQILARRQPVASDLRLIITALKIVTDLERMGDLGKNVCERVIELNQQPPLPIMPEFFRMADAMQQMVRDSLDAFVENSAEIAERVLANDEEVDDLYATIFQETVKQMTQEPGAIARANTMLWIAKHMERLGDHATNIAERVIYTVDGYDRRHTNNMEEPSETHHVRGTA